MLGPPAVVMGEGHCRSKMQDGFSASSVDILECSRASSYWMSCRVASTPLTSSLWGGRGVVYLHAGFALNTKFPKCCILIHCRPDIVGISGRESCFLMSP